MMLKKLCIVLKTGEVWSISGIRHRSNTFSLARSDSYIFWSSGTSSIKRSGAIERLSSEISHHNPSEFPKRSTTRAAVVINSLTLVCQQSSFTYSRAAPGSADSSLGWPIAINGPISFITTAKFCSSDVRTRKREVASSSSKGRRYST